MNETVTRAEQETSKETNTLTGCVGFYNLGL